MRDLLQKVQPTTWQDILTEAIDFSRDFVLFTDAVNFEEKTVILEENAFFRLHEIDLQKNPDQLADMTTLSYTRMLNRWQNINLDLSFGEAEFTLIQKGFESDRYCSYCFKDGKLCYEGDLAGFKKICFQAIRDHGTSLLLAKFYTFMIGFAPRWRKK